MARKRRTSAAAQSTGQLVYIASDCYLHVFHAAVRSGLQLVDELIASCFSKDNLRGFDKYYSSLAKMMNLWREKAADMMRAWDDQHGDAASKEIRDLGQRYPYSVSSGRWGSVESAEEFLLERGRALTEPCMLQVLSRSMKAAEASADHAATSTTTAATAATARAAGGADGPDGGRHVFA